MKPQLGRQAVALFVTAFTDGTPFTVGQGQEFLAARGFRRSQIGKRHVGEWIREARLQLADQNVSVTNPAVRLKYVSNPNATADERIVSRAQLIKDLTTRATNGLRYYGSDSQQVDASPKEIERFVRLKVASEILRELV